MIIISNFGGQNYFQRNNDFYVQLFYISILSIYRIIHTVLCVIVL